MELQRKIRVLVVDDHPLGRMLLLNQLRLLGCESVACEDGNTALGMLEAQAYDMVLTDLQMPGMNGYELSSIIHDRHAHVPVVAVTAIGEEIDAAPRGTGQGIVERLFKPTSLQDLCGILARHVAKGDAPGLEPGAASSHARGDFLHILKESSRKSLDRLRTALETDDRKTVLAEIHSMKGAMAMAGFPDLVQALEHLQKCLVSDDRQQFLEKLEAFEGDFQAL